MYICTFVTLETSLFIKQQYFIGFMLMQMQPNYTGSHQDQLVKYQATN